LAWLHVSCSVILVCAFTVFIAVNCLMIILKVKGRYVDLYSALDDEYRVPKALRHGSHSLACKQHHAFSNIKVKN